MMRIGGSRPEASPFVRYPHVLPALVRYVNNHPSLSYWFASECTGSASQGPRPDEGTREHRDELGLALDWLERLADRGELSPELLHTALAPLLGRHLAEFLQQRRQAAALAQHADAHRVPGAQVSRGGQRGLSGALQIQQVVGHLDHRDISMGDMKKGCPRGQPLIRAIRPESGRIRPGRPAPS